MTVVLIEGLGHGLAVALPLSLVIRLAAKPCRETYRAKADCHCNKSLTTALLCWALGNSSTSIGTHLSEPQALVPKPGSSFRFYCVLKVVAGFARIQKCTEFLRIQLQFSGRDLRLLALAASITIPQNIAVSACGSSLPLCIAKRYARVWAVHQFGQCCLTKNCLYTFHRIVHLLVQ